MVINNTREFQIMQGEIEEIARLLGASDSTFLYSDQIIVDETLSSYCNKSQCAMYGLAPSCPPHVSGPDGMRKFLAATSSVFVIKIDVPSSLLFSDQRAEIMRVLHGVVSGVEAAAVEKGYIDSISFAGGSCKDLFCGDFLECQMLSECKKCRNPQVARPSMSGFGVDVSKMMQAAGWSAEVATTTSNTMSWVAGMVLFR